jgi:two-component system NtrC family response regulator
MQKNPTIMLVEDEVQQREALAMMFESEGYTVLTADSAEAGARHIQETVPDMIVTDVKLPGIDGFTFFDTVRERPPFKHIPFIFITGYNDPAAIESVKKLGAAGYITKPYELEHLITLVKKHLPPSVTGV